MPEIPIEDLQTKQAAHATLRAVIALTTEWRTTMADLNASLDTLASDIQTQLQQVRDALAAAQAALDDKAALEQALADAQAVVDSADSRVQAFSADLKSDDPAPADEPA